MIPDIAEIYRNSGLFDPIDFFLYVATVCVLGTWIFMLSGLIGNHEPEGYPFGISKKIASLLLMGSGVFMAFVLAIKFFLL